MNIKLLRNNNYTTWTTGNHFYEIGRGTEIIVIFIDFYDISCEIQRLPGNSI